ncbi:MAG: TVP38/TMEM64 family protein [Alphaproteobacteria bacterium]|nr:TVP38/TMEM64 family protein [Alphaproteobacteria bacterium]
MTDASARPLGLRLLPLAILLTGLGVFFAAGGTEIVSFQTLSDRYADLEAYVAANRLTAALIFVALYAGLVSLVVFPGAVVLTLSGGLLFGTFVGGTLTVIGATIGATVVFLATRTAFADLLKRKAGARLSALQAGFEKNAFSYLLALRLTPLAPYYVVNIAGGVFGMKLSHYVVATLFGVMPATYVYSGLGAGLGATIRAGEDIHVAGLASQPEVVLPLIGLGLLSLAPVFLKRRKERAA